MYSGEITGNGLYDLLMFFLGQGHSGTINIESDSKNGNIVILENSIPMASFNGLIGKDALSALSNLGHLKFSFARSAKKPLEKPIPVPVQSLSVMNKKPPVERFFPEATIQKPDKVLEADLPVQKKSILNSLHSPSSVAQLAVLTKLSLPYLQEVLASMVEEGFVFIRPRFIVDNLFLFPKESSLGLSGRERQIFGSITNGMPLGEFLSRYENQTVLIADTLVLLVLKKMVAVSDDNGKIMPPWYIYKSIGLEKNARPVSLRLAIDNSLCVRPNTVTIDEFVIGMWENQLFGIKVNTVELDCPNGKVVFLVEKGRVLKDSFYVSPNDQKLISLPEGTFLDLKPKY